MVKTELRDCRRRATPEEVESAAAAAPAAEPDDDADAALEARLARIRSAGASRKRKEATASSTSVSTEPETVLDFRDEKVFFEGPPSRGDLAVNIALGATLLWLPLTFAAIGRAAWLRYRITDKRISIISTSPVDTSRTDVPYSRVQSVVGIGRGIGLWGDMVVNLDRGDKMEFRAVDDWMGMKKYIEEKAEEARAEAASGDTSAVASRPKAATLQGFGDRE